MKRRAFLAGLVGLPVAAKAPALAKAMQVRRLTVSQDPAAIRFLESQTYSIGQIERIFQLDPGRVTEWSRYKSNGQLMEEYTREYVEHVLIPYRNSIG